MAQPSEADLISAVKALRVSLLSYDPDTANDPQALAQRIKDDHFLWKSVTPKLVGEVLAKIVASEVPAYDMSKAEVFQPDFAAARGLVDFSGNDWFDRVYGVHHAQGGVGSKGCYILFLAKDEGVVVLKESNPDFVNEMFASNVARHLGLSAPRMRPLSLVEFRNLTWKLRGAKVSVKGTCGALHESRAQEGGGSLLEFLPGQVLQGTEHIDAFKNAEFNRALGRVIALDLLMNNFDRFPVVWQHKGNPSNLIIERTPEGSFKVHAIDQANMRILDEANRAAYVAKVKACIAEARSGKLGDCARKLRAFIESAVDEKISEAAVLDMMKGLEEQCQVIVVKGEDVLHRAAKETDALFAKAGVPVPREAFDLGFCLGVAKAMQL